MKEQFERSAMLLGVDNTDGLSKKRVAVFGVGGVGGYAAEALARTGIGALDFIDHDTVSMTNINRQIIATMETVGRNKAEVMKERVLSINPDAKVQVHDCFFLPENADEFRFEEYDYVVDAVDTVTAKLEIIERAKKAGVPVISAMGAGNKLDPTRFEVADISETSVCPLAKVMRRELKKRGIEKVKVVYSKEEAKTPIFEPPVQEETRKKAPGSVAFVPSVAGLIVAGEVIKDLTR
ncbi:MAG: tRNA threonylcarbamoyladenosine dehydratase [Lachnospiraceae bacterium]|nr:tRNA threonylcarbamoyladenosine dehydratase [Lachnospiraceae bacterium]